MKVMICLFSIMTTVASAQEVSGYWTRKTEPDRVTEVKSGDGRCKVAYSGQRSAENPLAPGGSVAKCFEISGFKAWGKVVVDNTAPVWKGGEIDKPGYHYECWTHRSRCYVNEEGLELETYGEARDGGQLRLCVRARVYSEGICKSFAAGYLRFESTLQPLVELKGGVKREAGASLPMTLKVGTGGFSLTIPLGSTGTGVGQSRNNPPPKSHDQTWTETKQYDREHRNHLKVGAFAREKKGDGRSEGEFDGRNVSNFSLRERVRVKKQGCFSAKEESDDR